LRGARTFFGDDVVGLCSVVGCLSAHVGLLVGGCCGDVFGRISVDGPSATLKRTGKIRELRGELTKPYASREAF
jgi:hypothetical protein